MCIHTDNLNTFLAQSTPAALSVLADMGFDQADYSADSIKKIAVMAAAKAYRQKLKAWGDTRFERDALPAIKSWMASNS